MFLQMNRAQTQDQDLRMRMLCQSAGGTRDWQ